MSKRSPDRTASDRALWQQVATTIKPLHKAKATPATARTLPNVRKENYVPKAPVHHAKLKPVSTSQSEGIDASTYKKLRSGELPIAGRLDLHGMTQTQAHAALTRFIHHGYHNGRRCVLIITGRSGVLREQTPRWLNEAELRPYLIALAPALPGHGGAGAMYALLKRRRD
jgi:DNA-nicking Smr family endonuclease